MSGQKQQLKALFCLQLKRECRLRFLKKKGAGLELNMQMEMSAGFSKHWYGETRYYKVETRNGQLGI